MTAPSGNFIKTGTGTLTFTQPVTLAGDTTTGADANRKKELNLSPDRAPTQGYGPFTIANGTVVIDTPGDGATAPATNVLGSAAVNSIIGVCAPAAGAEATGVLEQRGGVSYFPSHLVLGMSNGADAERPLEPTLRVTGGRLLVGKTGTKYIYAGANSVSGVKSRVRTVIDVDMDVGALVGSDGSAGVITGEFSLMKQGLTRITYLSSGAQIFLDDEVLTSGKGGSYDSAMGIQDAKNSIGAEDVWVKGYIVGGDLSSSKASFSKPFTSNTNLVIAARSSEKNKSACMSVQLQKGAIRDALNLVDHPELIGKSVCLRGDIVASYYGIPGIQNISEFVFGQ